jgi:hypothetical protein
MCHISITPVKKSITSPTVINVMAMSEKIMIFFRFHLSTSGPMNGPSTIDGNNATSRAVASIVALPVSRVKYHASANSTTALPIKENAWLIQSTKNFLIAVSPL